ncbi:thiol-activated cytolysin family protein [Pedobacter sp. NJ-S-72]
MLLSVVLLNACKKNEKLQESPEGQKITNELNQFKDLKTPETSKSAESDKKKSGLTRMDATGDCAPVLHTQSTEFDKLSVLDPSTDIMYVGSLMDGASIQNGTYKPLFLPSDYVRKPITYSVSIQGSNSPIIKTINPDLASFRNSMQEVMNSYIVGQQPANFTFELVHARSRREIEMKIGANLKIGSFFSSVANYNESSTSTRSYYLLKIYQKFFSADINIPADGNLFNKPANFDGTVAPVYISTIDYGRSAYLLMESSFDSTRVQKALEASFAFWKIGGGASVSEEHKEVMDNMTISGTIVGGSSTDAAKTINGVQAFHDYVVNSGNLGPDSRGEIIAYKLRNAKDHGIYKTLINGDYYSSDCYSELSAVTASVYNMHSSGPGGVNYLSIDGVIPGGFKRTGTAFKAYKKQIAGTVPIYEYIGYNKSGEWSPYDYLYNQSPTQNNYWRYQKVAFYAFNTQVPGSVPIYANTSHGNKDWLFSTWPGNDSYWKNWGVYFYAFPVN